MAQIKDLAVQVPQRHVDGREGIHWPVHQSELEPLAERSMVPLDQARVLTDQVRRGNLVDEVDRRRLVVARVGLANQPRVGVNADPEHNAIARARDRLDARYLHWSTPRRPMACILHDSGSTCQMSNSPSLRR